MRVDQIQLAHDVVEPLDLSLDRDSILVKALANLLGLLAALLNAGHRPCNIADQQDLFARCQMWPGALISTTPGASGYRTS
jgi:hypothetical protein